jgi:hypothetical protein
MRQLRRQTCILRTAGLRVYINDLKPLGGESCLCVKRFRCQDKYHITTTILPSLSQGKTAHYMAAAHIYAGVDAYQQNTIT